MSSHAFIFALIEHVSTASILVYLPQAIDSKDSSFTGLRSALNYHWEYSPLSDLIQR